MDARVETAITGGIGIATGILGLAIANLPAIRDALQILVLALTAAVTAVTLWKSLRPPRRRGR